MGNMGRRVDTIGVRVGGIMREMYVLSTWIIGKYYIKLVGTDKYGIVFVQSVGKWKYMGKHFVFLDL